MPVQMKLPTKTGHMLGSHPQICFKLISLTFGEIAHLFQLSFVVCFSSFSVRPGLNNHHVLLLGCDLIDLTYRSDRYRLYCLH